MPIDFACGCGKQFRVADEFAGKRSKCPTCGIAVSVPNAPPALTEEELAFRALNEGPEPEPNNRSWREPSFNAPPTIPPKPIERAPVPSPVKKKPKKASSSDPYASRERRWSIDWSRVAGGGLGVLIGGGLLLGGLAVGRFFIWSPVIIIGGLVGIINGLTHKDY